MTRAHRHRRRRGEHRPVAAPDSRGRGLPRQRLRLGGGSSRPSEAARRADLYLLDVRLPDGNGIDLLRSLRQWDDAIAVVMISGHGTIADAVEATQDRRVRLPREAARARPRAAGRQERARAVGPAAREPALPRAGRRRAEDDRIERRRSSRPCEQATQVARSDVSVLLSGESGTGKELLAAHIHRESPFAAGPFVKVNCAAIPTELIESELFGHEKGAFTGAAALRRGKFELADGGTIFLDEVGDLHEASQAKLLRVLQDGELQRVGGEQTDPRDRPRHLGDEPAARRARRGRPVPGGSLLSAERRADPRAGAARAAAGHRRAGAVLPAEFCARNNFRPRDDRSRTPSRCSSATPGPATSASCGTSWSGWRSSRLAIGSPRTRSRWRSGQPHVAAPGRGPAGSARLRRARAHPAGAGPDRLERRRRGAAARHRADGLHKRIRALGLRRTSTPSS